MSCSLWFFVILLILVSLKIFIEMCNNDLYLV